MERCNECCPDTTSESGLRGRAQLALAIVAGDARNPGLRELLSILFAREPSEARQSKAIYVCVLKQASHGHSSSTPGTWRWDVFSTMAIL